MKKLLSIISAAILAISLAACGSQPTLVGKWEREMKGYSEPDYLQYWEFTDNQTFTESESFYNSTHSGRYYIMDGKLIIDFGNATKREYNYELKGDTLTVQNRSNGMSVDFKRSK